MNTPGRNPEEIKDRLSAELAARVPGRQALLDEAAEVFGKNGMLEDCPDDKPEYVAALAELSTRTAALEEAKFALPPEFENLKNMDFAELGDTINAMIFAPDFKSRPDSDRKALYSLRDKATEVGRAHDRIDVQHQPKSGAIRRMARAKTRLAKPNPERLAEVAKAYGEICDLIDKHTFEVRSYLMRDQTDSSIIARKVDEFNNNFQSWIAARYIEGNRIKSGENLTALKAKMKSPVEAHTNHGITVQLCTKLDGWWLDLSFNSKEYTDGVAKESAERHAILERDRAAEERSGTRTRVGDVYGSSSSPGREKA